MSWFNKIMKALWTEVSTPSPSAKSSFPKDDKQAPTPCKTCNGLGNVLVNNEEVFPCPTCGGQSTTEQVKNQAGLKCAMCGGTGKGASWLSSSPCKFCDGTGYVQFAGAKRFGTNPSQSFIFPNQKSKVCPICKGKKWVEIADSDTSIFSINKSKQRQVCVHCRGTGKVQQAHK